MQSERRILDSLRQLVQGLRVSSREAESRIGISGAQLFVLRVLADEGPITINELAAKTRTHQSSVSVVVTRLAEKKLVSRRKSEIDARRMEVSITPLGRSRLRVRKPLAQERLIASIQKLSAREQAALARLLQRVVGEAGFDQRPSLFFEESKK